MIYIKNNQIKDSNYPNLIIAEFKIETDIKIYFYNEICDLGYKYVLISIIKTIYLLLIESNKRHIKIDNKEGACLYIKIAIRYLENNLFEKISDNYIIDSQKIHGFKYQNLLPKLIQKYKHNISTVFSKQDISQRINSTEKQLPNSFFNSFNKEIQLEQLLYYYQKHKKGQRFLIIENKIKETLKEIEDKMVNDKIAYILKNSHKQLDTLLIAHQYIELSNWTEGKQIIKNSLEYLYNIIKNEENSYSIEKTMKNFSSYPMLFKYNEKVAIKIIRKIIQREVDDYSSPEKETIYKIQDLLNDKVKPSTQLEDAIYELRDKLKKYY